MPEEQKIPEEQSANSVKPSAKLNETILPAGQAGSQEQPGELPPINFKKTSL